MDTSCLTRNFRQIAEDGSTRAVFYYGPRHVYGLIRNNIFNYGCVNNNYGNVQVYEVYATPAGRVGSWETLVLVGG